MTERELFFSAVQFFIDAVYDNSVNSFHIASLIETATRFILKMLTEYADVYSLLNYCNNNCDSSHV